MPEPTLWIRNAAEVIPVTEGFPVIEDGAVVCAGDRIAWVGPDGRWPDELAPGPDAAVLDARGGVVLPGLVECHTHLVFGGSRAGELARRLQGETYAQILEGGGGILGTVRATREASHEELLGRARARIRDLLRRGVTTVEIKSGYGLDWPTERKILEVAAELHREGPWDVVSTFLGAHAVPPEFRDDREGYLRVVIEEMIPAVAEAGLARFCDVFCEPGLAYDVDESRRVLQAARAAGLQLKVHADQLHDGGGGALAGELGAASAEHLDHVSEAGIAALADAGTVAVLLPGAQYFLDGPAPPLAALQEAGVPVALSTDCNPGSSPTTDLLLMASMACVRWRMTMPDVLAAITTVAARALALEHDRGALAPGMRADLAVFDVADHRDLPYWFGHDPCAAVVKDGAVVVAPVGGPG